MKKSSPDGGVQEDATENLNGQLNRLVSQLVGRGVTLAQARQTFERQFIVASLRLHNGNVSRSAQNLGIHRNTLRNKVDGLGIQSADYRNTSKRIQSR